jgi:hypothetical protein
MTSVNRDDIRAAVGAGMISEAQAASLVALSDARRGVRDRMTGLDEPFELFKGFNEIFIVVGLSIFFAGWLGLTGLSLFEITSIGYIATMVYAALAAGAVILLARYFTLKRRMVAPSIALAIFFGISTAQFGMGLSWMFRGDLPMTLTLGAGLSTVLLCAYYAVFRVPFAMALIALGVFATCFGIIAIGGTLPEDPRDLFLLSAEGPFAVLTIVLGLVGLAVALRFDMSDPHRVTRRSSSGFWLHVIAAPAIVNTVSLTLFDIGTVTAQLMVLVFVLAMAIFAIAIDRRSFLVSGVGYIVALAFTVMEGAAFLSIFMLGLVLIVLGAQWENIRRAIMNTLPSFPGKTRLPPWGMLTPEEPIT